MVSSFSFPVLNPSDFALIEDAQSLPGKKQKVKRLLFKEHERLARSVVVAVETMSVKYQSWCDSRECPDSCRPLQKRDHFWLVVKPNMPLVILRMQSRQ